jgi:hypothetical protein
MRLEKRIKTPISPRITSAIDFAIRHNFDLPRLPKKGQHSDI